MGAPRVSGVVPIPIGPVEMLVDGVPGSALPGAAGARITPRRQVEFGPMAHPPSGRNPDVCVVVRCHNEAPVVRGVIEELKTVFDDVVGVDDGSTDGSA